ncbi:uncharacterized protein BCR38DRAFT_433241 [Pseudomassariella vexata]|uniref:Uncharacterized protein n=1 Tax=Pseudomassariella vexata TaxID=1141098 RepID=A0A1Y2DX54_9PEZI|nr:uncharacterized protein BCR38DRAFT_433241 [Pseudomassariella vexata]ORY63843.1 hypothetical protein BCR38DRAFT_433241 [Pseudomassariella vexata]
MLMQEGKQPKLTPKWRGPFIVNQQTGRGSFRLVNLDESSTTKFDYHQDMLKLFKPRGGYLKTADDLTRPMAQALRRQKRSKLRQ